LNPSISRVLPTISRLSSLQQLAGLVGETIRFGYSLRGASSSTYLMMFFMMRFARASGFCFLMLLPIRLK
jgi:hypothetical protein